MTYRRARSSSVHCQGSLFSSVSMGSQFFLLSRLSSAREAVVPIASKIRQSLVEHAFTAAAESIIAAAESIICVDKRKSCHVFAGTGLPVEAAKIKINGGRPFTAFSVLPESI